MVITQDVPGVELIDLEDLYFQGQPPATYKNCGSPGYAHPSHTSQACAEGDRYAAAIMAAEMLLLTDHDFAAQAGDTGLFGEDHLSPPAAALFRGAEDWLAVFAPELLGPFRRARASASLADCPRIAELCTALEALAAAAPRLSKRIWIEPEETPSPRIRIELFSTPPTMPTPPVFVASTRIRVERDLSAAEVAAAPPAPAPVTGSMKKTAPPSGTGYGWLFLAVLIFLLILWFFLWR